MSRALMVLSAATLGVVGVGCSDDDDDNPVDDVEEDVDLDPGEGTGLPSDDNGADDTAG